MDQHSPDRTRRILIGGMAGLTCIAEDHAGSPQEIHKWVNGNHCRCGAYDHIVIFRQDPAHASGSVQGG
jgi:xanthine dehydrogenase YagT iron-sulfur-binding subunit